MDARNPVGTGEGFVIEAISREEFERNLGESGVLPEAALREALAGLAGEPDITDGHALARHLIRLGHLTPYQTEAVRLRRFHELCVGNYIVLEHIGTGGMGTVFKARHRRMKRAVALKVLRREGASLSFTRRFEREIETIAQLSHPNIVMAYDADEAEVGPFLVMEYVDGCDLGAEVRQSGPLSVAEAVEATVQAARGLDYAHGRGFIHRDVKPANLLRDVRGQTKVADLGLARLEEHEGESASAVTMAGNVVGTVEYMAPEQAVDSSAIDQRSDIYALGCTLFYLLTGRAPYQAPSLMGLLLKHRDAPIPSLAEARPDVPAEVAAIFQRMAAKRREDRYETMAGVIAALEGVRGISASLVARPGHIPGADGSGMPPTTVSVDAMRRPLTEVTLADVAAAGPSDAVDSSVARQMGDLTVVIVEPSRAQAGIVRRYLRDLGIERVTRAASGAEALELVRREGADVLFSAMHLADMTGADLARAVRSDPACAGVGFVLASSESDGGRSGEYHVGPGMALLAKPFDLPALAQSLAHATGRGSDEIPPAPG
jgi:serine/threonine-protein kinase